jgi:hypothetical protein
MSLLPGPPLAGESTLLLVRIGEPSTNDLRLVLLEMKRQPILVDTELGPANPVEPDETSRAFELIWWRYVAYSVRNEGFYQPEEGQPSPEGLIGTRASSAYLTYVTATTFASDDYPGPLTHWFVNAEWHCIDVVSDSPPEVRELSPEEVSALIGTDRSPQGFAASGRKVH